MIFRSPPNSPSVTRLEHGGNFSSVFWKPWGQVLTLGLAAGILVSGCHKKSAAQAPPPEPAAGPTTGGAPAAPAAHGPVAQPLPASSQTIAANANADEVAGQLTQELQRYVVYTRSIPKNFEEFTARDPIKFPPPPPGKKYVISDGKVVLK